MRRYKKRISRIVAVAMLFVFLIGNSNMVHAMEKTQVGYASKYITVKGNNMHLALYGKLDASGEKFADEGKTTLVMMPALGVPSPHIYFKPLSFFVAFLCHLAYRSSESHLPKSMLFDGRCNRLFFYFQKVYKKVLRYAKIF